MTTSNCPVNLPVYNNMCHIIRVLIENTAEMLKDNFKYFTQSGIGLNNHIIYFSCVSSDNIAVPTTRVHSFVFVAGNVLMEKRLCTATNSNITALGEVSEPPEKTPPTQFKSYHFL